MKKYLPILLLGLLASCIVHKTPRTPQPKRTFIGGFEGFNLTIDSYGSDSVFKNRLVYVKFPETMNDYLESQEIKNYFINTFKEKGYSITNNYQDAELLIGVDWNIEKHTYTTNDKVATKYETRHVKSVSTQTDQKMPQPNQPPVYNSETETKHYYDDVPVEYSIVKNTHMYHSGNIHLNGYNKQLYENNKTDAKLFSTYIFSTSATNDLRYTLSHMLFGAFNFIGKNSGGKIKENFYYTTPLLQTIKGA